MKYKVFDKNGMLIAILDQWIEVLRLDGNVGWIEFEYEAVWRSMTDFERQEKKGED